MTQVTDTDKELVKTPRLELCDDCRHIRPCIQFLGATFSWLKADLGKPKKIWRCEECTPKREREREIFYK